MAFIIKDRDGKIVQLPVRVSTAENYQAVYAHGAQGGPLANYHFRIDFYQDIVPPMRYTDPTGTGKVLAEELKEGLERKIVATVYLSLPFAKELQLWLEKTLKGVEEEYGTIQLPKGESSFEEARKKLGVSDDLPSSETG